MRKILSRTEAASSMVVLSRIEGVRRRRVADLASLLRFFAETCAVTDRFVSVGDKGSYFEIGTALSVTECGRIIGIDGALLSQESNRRHLSGEQVDYVGGLVRDVPEALRMALAGIGKGTV